MLSSLSCKVFAFTHLLFYYHKKQLNINRSLVEILFIHLQFLGIEFCLYFLKLTFFACVEVPFKTIDIRFLKGFVFHFVQYMLEHNDRNDLFVC